MLSCHATAYDRSSPRRSMPRTSRPASVTVPDAGRSMPIMSFAIVDLPLPLRPTIAVTAPRAAAALTSWSTGWSAP